MSFFFFFFFFVFLVKQPDQTEKWILKFLCKMGCIFRVYEKREMNQTRKWLRYIEKMFVIAGKYCVWYNVL